MTDRCRTTTETFNVCVDWASMTTKHVWTCPDGRIGKVVKVRPHPFECYSYGGLYPSFHIHRIITLEVRDHHD